MTVLNALLFIGGVDTSKNSLITSDLDDAQHDIGRTVVRSTMPSFPARVNNYPVSQASSVKNCLYLRTWGDDFYDRIHVSPYLIDLGTIASIQTRQIEVWNAWRRVSAQLASIDISGTLIFVTGESVPYSFRPLHYEFFEVTVPTTGTPEVMSQIQFNFSNVSDPNFILITAIRAVRFDTVPEVPVRESWKWFTDLMVSTDGSEQRVAIRGEAPRVELEIKGVFTSKSEIQDLYGKLLTSAGRLWIPEYQYGTLTTQQTEIDGTIIYLDTNTTDVRVGEYLMVSTTNGTFLSEVQSVSANSVTLVSGVDIVVPKGSVVAPGAPSLLDNGTRILRYAVDEVGEVSLRCKFQRYRDTLTRPGVASQMDSFLGHKVLTKVPLVEGTVGDGFYTGQEAQDNQTGVFDLISNWDSVKVGGDTRKYKINRIHQPSELDYWKEFFGWCRGRTRMFFSSSYRQDFNVTVIPSATSTSMTLDGDLYALKLWSNPEHRYLELETEAGIHRIKVESASETIGDSGIVFSPPWPGGPGTGWDVIKRVSLLLPLRLDSDEVTIDHYHLDSFITFAVRTAEGPTT